MAVETSHRSARGYEQLRDDKAFLSGLQGRHLRGSLWMRFFQFAILLGLIALLTLLFNVVNRIVGLTAVRDAVPVSTFSDRPLEELSEDELAAILVARLPSAGRVLVRDILIGQENYNNNRDLPLSQLIQGVELPAEVGAKTLGELQPADTQAIFTAAFQASDMIDTIVAAVVGREVLESWTLTDSLFNRSAIEERLATNPNWEGAVLEWRSWLNVDFLSSRMTTTASESGVRAALLGSLVTIFLTIVIAFPLGVGTAIYLEEYATGDNWFERIIETNIRNLAGVPSIIYGLLGLAIFVRSLASITQGRTIISAALTMALLILPVIIINAQEALRAVPPSIREASFGLGATRWQTIWNSVLPAAMPGILTGTILGMSRAVGETAPLIVIGAATFIANDPTLTSRFTVIPIQIYNWAKDPREGYAEIAAAAIVLLLVVLLLFNAVAIYFRQRFRRKLSA